jgi:hypothetical protein
MTDRLSELPIDAVEAFRAESAGKLVAPRPGYDQACRVVERRGWA